MTKEEIEHAEKFLDAYLGGNRNVSTLTWKHWIECLADYGKKLQSENERLIKEIEDIVVECILDDIDFGYDLATIKGKIKSGSYVGNSPETFKENERMNQENKEIIRKLIAAETRIVQLKKENEMLKVEREWISVETPPDKTGNYLISDVSNLFYLVFYHAFSNQWLMANKTVQVKFWHELPQPPKQSCPQCKTEYTKEELLTNEHCFKCGFEMKGF